MKLHSTIHWRILVTALCGLVLAAVVFGPSARADQWDKMTVLTVNQPIQVEETLLPAGRYVFKLLNSNSDRHIVQIFNGDQSHIINTVLAIPNYRLQPTGDSRFAFWETPPGNAKALRAWFYPGDNFGQEFRYPRHLTVLEASAAATITSAPAPAPEPAPVEAPAPAPAPQPAQPEAQPEAQPAPSNPPETAEAAPAPPPPAAPAPPPQEAPPPQTLPKTASSYPMVGLAGLLSLGMYGLLRLKRSA